MDARASRYHEVYARWQRDPQGFWGEAAQAIDWMEPPKKVFDPDAGVYPMVGPGQAYDEMITGDHIPSRTKTEIRSPDASEMF